MHTPLLHQLRIDVNNFVNYSQILKLTVLKSATNYQRTTNFKAKFLAYLKSVKSI